MHLLVIGATGKTGQAVVTQGLDAGHHITALARSPEKLTTTHPNLQSMQGDVRDAAQIAAAFSDQSYDAVLFTVGGGDLKKTDVRTVGTRHVVAAMQQHAPQTLLVILSSLLTGESKQQVGIPARWIVAWILRNPLADHESQEALVRASDLPYVIVRPGGLNDDPGTGDYKISQPPEPANGNSSIARADVAHFMLRAVSDPQYHQQAITLTPN